MIQVALGPVMIGLEGPLLSAEESESAAAPAGRRRHSVYPQLPFTRAGGRTGGVHPRRAPAPPAGGGGP